MGNLPDLQPGVLSAEDAGLRALADEAVERIGLNPNPVVEGGALTAEAANRIVAADPGEAANRIVSAEHECFARQGERSEDDDPNTG